MASLVAEKTHIMKEANGFETEDPDRRKLKKMTCFLGNMIVPICTGTHWYLLAVGPEHAWVLCSMGGRYRVLERNIKRLLGKTCIYPKVPKQTNGRDCGVFTVMYAVGLLKESNWSQIQWPTLVSSDIEDTGRQLIQHTLMKWCC
ncbi:uncharacterized protein LOC124283839 [Haliotis rubra]|uniref:uncharacterized protein LOC124283839 n=1 Tax=Haliotis rubra TaxID=36100 RepID=UPI001EE5A167|nr:uncharacterized protein LOC124283839 [Haliotis rubra]